jgi:membrane protein YqaA with SNARE-associated domain
MALARARPDVTRRSTAVSQPSAISPLPSVRRARDADLDAYVRRNLVIGATFLFALIGSVGLATVLYEQELFQATQAIHHTVGVAGLGAILFVSDALITPIPPDFLLVIIAKSNLRFDWVGLIAGMGVLSTIAGNCGWLMGVRLGEAPFLQRIFGRLRERNERLVARYGSLGVALGALTPIPFSVTCWAAGLMRLRFASVFWPSLLRIPRFFVYYVLIAYSDRFVRLFF